MLLKMLDILGTISFSNNFGRELNFGNWSAINYLKTIDGLPNRSNNTRFSPRREFANSERKNK